jgi:outer membrane immunogenic protein
LAAHEDLRGPDVGIEGVLRQRSADVIFSQRRASVAIFRARADTFNPGLSACILRLFDSRVAQNGSRLPLSNPSAFASATLRPSVYVGYNWQIGNWVVGAEADAGWGKARNDMKGIPGAENLAATASPGLDTAAVSTTWDATLRARAGFLIGTNVLLYATGGASWIHLETSAYCGSPRNLVGWCAGPAGPGSNLNTESIASTTRVGWTGGVGAEAMLWSNWLTRIEYRYANYGTYGFTLFPGSGACGVGCDTIAAEATLRTHTVLAGFAYKFGGPLVAR